MIILNYQNDNDQKTVSIYPIRSRFDYNTPLIGEYLFHVMRPFLRNT